MKNRAFKILASIMSMVLIMSVIPFSSYAYLDDNIDSEHQKLTSIKEIKPVAQNGVSDWVKASSAPENAEIVNTKWTYTLRSYTTNSNSSLAGWTKYDTVRTGWGATQGPVYSNPSNGERNVRSENYISGYNKKAVDIYYRYYPEGEYYQSAKASGWLTDPATGNRYNYSIHEEFRSDQYNITASESGFHVNFGDGGWVWAYYSRQEQIDDTNSPVYSTRWYYQDPVYTYYYYKDNSMETYIGDPTGQTNVSNVVKYVQYRTNTGKCGNNVFYHLDDYGVLTISGTGKMYDYESGDSPFFFNSTINTVVIENDVTSVGKYAFDVCSNLNEVFLGANISDVSESAFGDCLNLSIVTVTSENITMAERAFYNNSDNLMFVVNEKNTDAVNYAKEKNIPAVTFSYSESEKQLSFNGNTVIYEGLEYNYLAELAYEYSDTETLYFKHLEFDGVEPEVLGLDPDVIVLDIDNNIEIDKKSENLAYNNLYVNFSVIRDGKEEKVSFGKIFELLENGDYDAFKMHLYSDEEATEQTFIERVAQAIEAFFEDAIRVITKVINFVASIFKKK